MKIKIAIASLIMLTSINCLANEIGIRDKASTVFYSQNTKLVGSLIRNGVDPNQSIEMYNTTPMMHAVESGSFDVVKRLISYGSSVDVADNFGNTPLMQSIKNNDDKIAKTLIEHSRNINSKDSSGSTALHHAAKQGNEVLFKEILKRGGNLKELDHSGNNVLFYAIAGRNKNIVNRLINMGYFDLKHSNFSGEKAVHVAQRYGLNDIAQHLARGRNW